MPGTQQGLGCHASMHHASSLVQMLTLSSRLQASIARGLAYAPFADLLWVETSTPDMEEAKQFAAAIHDKYPGKLLAYNCSPSFNWKKKLSDSEIAEFQKVCALWRRADSCRMQPSASLWLIKLVQAAFEAACITLAAGLFKQGTCVD